MNTQQELPLHILKRRWIDDASMALDGLLRHEMLGDFTVDDLHWYLPEPQHANWWGALIARYVVGKRIREVRRVASKRASANGRKVSVWRVNK